MRLNCTRMHINIFKHNSYQVLPKSMPLSGVKCFPITDNRFVWKCAFYPHFKYMMKAINSFFFIFKWLLCKNRLGFVTLLAVKTHDFEPLKEPEYTLYSGFRCFIFTCLFIDYNTFKSIEFSTLKIVVSVSCSMVPYDGNCFGVTVFFLLLSITILSITNLVFDYLTNNRKTVI